MNISDIKALIGQKEGFPLPTLMINDNFEEDGVTPTGYVDHWDNDHRVRVVMAKDIYESIKANPAFDGLALKPVQVEEAKTKPDGKVRAAYRRYVIITPKNILGTI